MTIKEINITTHIHDDIIQSIQILNSIKIAKLLITRQIKKKRKVFQTRKSKTRTEGRHKKLVSIFEDDW